MRRPAEDEDGGLDSLLDTLSNVVGILVIVLIVVQLSMGQTVKRIVNSERVDPALVEQARQELAATERQQAQLAREIEAQGFSPQQVEQALARLRAQLADAQADLRHIEAARAEAARQARAQAEAARAKAQQQLETFQQEQTRLEQQLAQRQDELARLDLQLKSVPLPQLPPAKVVTLPDPRPAPKGAQPVTILCWGGKVLAADLEDLRDRAQKRFAYVVTSKRLDRNPAAGLDAAAVCAEFQKVPLRDPMFEIELVAVGVNPYLKLVPKAGAGESAEQLQRSTSDYYRRLRQIAHWRGYVRFIVWGDSFETYVVARRVADEAGVLAGWQFVGTPPHYLYWIGGGKFRFGPPPPKPDPRTPTPPPKQTPPPPPVDEID